jgi:hypothetical protein
MATKTRLLLGTLFIGLLAAPFQPQATAAGVGNATAGLAYRADAALKRKPLVDVMTEYLPVKVQEAGKKYFTGKTRTTSELHSVLNAFSTDFMSKYADVAQAHIKAQAKLTGKPATMGPTKGLEDFDDWYAQQLTVVGGISFWYVPFMEWCRTVWDYTQLLEKGAERAPKKFAELHKLMKEANKKLLDIRQNCKIGSEKDIKRHLRHAARARATAVNVQQYVVDHRKFVLDSFNNPKLSPATLKAAGQARLKGLPARHASTATHPILRDFHAPAVHAFHVTGAIQLYKACLDDYKKAAKPLTEQTLFSDLEFFKSLPFDQLLKNVEAEQERCKAILHDHRMKYDARYRKRNGG